MHQQAKTGRFCQVKTWENQPEMYTIHNILESNNDTKLNQSEVVQNGIWCQLSPRITAIDGNYYRMSTVNVSMHNAAWLNRRHTKMSLISYLRQGESAQCYKYGP